MGSTVFAEAFSAVFCHDEVGVLTPVQVVVLTPVPWGSIVGSVFSIFFLCNAVLCFMSCSLMVLAPWFFARFSIILFSISISPVFSFIFVVPTSPLQLEYLSAFFCIVRINLSVDHTGFFWFVVVGV